MGINLEPARTEPQRDRYGRYILPDTNGNPISYTRATTVASTLEDKHGVHQWEIRKAIKGVVMSDARIATAQAHNPDTDRGTYRELIQSATDAAGATDARQLGSALHKFTEEIDHGLKTIDDIPPPYQERVAAYYTKIGEYGIHIEPEGIERILIDDNANVAGTADRVPLIFPDGNRYIGDLKCGSDPLRYGAMAICCQLAMYAGHTATYDLNSGKRQPRIDVNLEWGVIIHLPANGTGCELHWVDLTYGWVVYQTALRARELRKQPKSRHAPIVPAMGPPPLASGDLAGPAWIKERIQTMAAYPDAVAMLREHWPATVPKPFPSETATAEMVADMSRVLQVIEDAHMVAFTNPHPGLRLQPPTNHRGTK